MNTTAIPWSEVLHPLDVRCAAAEQNHFGPSPCCDCGAAATYHNNYHLTNEYPQLLCFDCAKTLYVVLYLMEPK